MNWEALNAVSAATSAGVVLLATTIALRQFRESLQTRHLQGVLGLAQQLESRSVRSTRAFLRAHRHELIQVCQNDGSTQRLDETLKRLSKGEVTLQRVRDDLAVLEYAALLAVHGMVPETLGTAYLLPIVTTAWPDLWPVIQVQRRAHGTDVYLQHFQALYLLAITGAFEDRAARKRTVEALRTRSLSLIKDRWSQASSITERSVE